MSDRREAEARLVAYANITVNHPRLAEVDRQVTAAIREKAGYAHLLVYGPGGVGKSTMLRHILDRFAGEAPAGTVPLVRVEARTGDSGVFNRSDYYRQVLAGLAQHVVVKHILVNVQEARGGRGGRAAFDGLELRDAMEEALRRLKVRAVIIDEAQLLMKVDKAERLLEQLDWLKSMTNMTDTLHILAGSYDLLDFRNLSGQSARRGRDIHFPRYHFAAPDERTSFQAAVKYLLDATAVPCDLTDILGQWQFLYQRSIGCVGNVKEWLMRALAEALEQPEPRITWALLQEQAPTVAQSMRMAMDATAGEQRLAKTTQSDGDLRSVLGMPEAAPPAAPATPPGGDAAKPKGRRGRPKKTESDS